MFRKHQSSICLTGILHTNGDADAICVDGGDVHRGSLSPYKLKPIAAENYGTEKEPDTCYYAVAVVKKSSTFMFNDLKDKTSCHTGLGKSSGWNAILGQLLKNGVLKWEGQEMESLEKAMANFVRAACVPGATEPKLCELCKGKGNAKCSRSGNEPYYNYAGAKKCLTDGTGQVAYVKHTTFPPAQYDKEYELLCTDGTRKPLADFKDCHMARVSAHAVVTRENDDAKTADIIEYLKEAQEKKCNLFGSQFGNDLMFKDSAVSVITLPPKTDALLYLGAEDYNTIQAFKHAEKAKTKSTTVRWCTQSKQEKEKCDKWSTYSGGAIECTVGTSAENCIHQVLKGEADAVTLDGGYLYTAGECGLVPVMSEYYDKGNLAPCRSKTGKAKGSYLVVAVVKKSNKDIKWPNLQGLKTCHTGIGRTAGWNVPVGHLVGITKNCDMSTYFSESCAPGADVNSNLCKLCIGDPRKKLENTKCSPSDAEGYHGYAGAMRCGAEVGDVAFVKDSTPLDNTDGKNPAAWAKDLKSTDFELLCPDGSRKPITKAKECNLGEVSPHGVVTRPEKRKDVLKVVSNQQVLFGKEGTQTEMFQMFASKNGADQLFKDSCQCLLPIDEKTTMKEYLGESYFSSVTNLNKCPTKSALLSACTFHSC